MFVIRRFFMERNVGKSLSSTLTCVSNNQQQTIFKSSTTGIMSNFEGKRTIHLSLTHCFGDLKEIFGFKDSNISNWVVEAKVQNLCCTYADSSKAERTKFLRTLAFDYGINHHNVVKHAEKLIKSQIDNKRQIVMQENNMKNSLVPLYYWLFLMMGRLECGVKFLVDLRTDILDLINESKDSEEIVVIQQLNSTLRDLLLLWFSVGFLHLERITWQSSCEMLQKISDYEAIHPIKNWVDLKRRVGPFRRCYVFTHPSMPNEPLVVLHTALCDVIPETVKGIEEAERRILGEGVTLSSFSQEDKSNIQAAVFYSIASTQRGLQGIELGNYLLKEVARQVSAEFRKIRDLATLSPIPNFRLWILERVKQNPKFVFTNDELCALEQHLGTNDVSSALKQLFNNSLWITNEKFVALVREPLLRACAWYLYKEKRRNYALNIVANFHMRNGAFMWRINWMADPSPRGVSNSFGIMINYKYILNETEQNSRNYIEKYYIKASESINKMSGDALSCREQG